MPTFLHPALLAGMVLAAIPVVLHLLMKQKPKRLEFPSLRLVKVKQQANTRRLKIRHWLLLLFRILAVCIMAAGLARPSLHASRFAFDQEAPVAAALVFDASPRMDYRSDNQTRLEAAQAEADWLLGQLPQSSQVGVYSSSIGGRSAGDAALPATGGAFGEAAVAARQRIERLRSTAVVRPLAEVVSQALDQLAQAPLDRKEVYVFTDLSRSAWRDDAFPALAEKLKQAAGVGLYVIDLGSTDPRNMALGDVRLSNQVLPKSSPLEIELSAMRQGPKSTRNVELFVLDEQGKPTKRGEQTLELDAGQQQVLTFRVDGFPAGIHQGYVRLVGDDGLKHDDVRYFSVEVRPAWKVLAAGPWPAPSGPYLHPSDFLLEALAPAEERRLGAARFDGVYRPAADLLREKLDDYAVVTLLDPGPLAPQIWTHLRNYVQNGGRLAVFLGAQALARPAAFNQPEPQSLLAGELDFAGRAGEELFLTPNNFSHPLLARFRSFETNPWTYYPVYRYWKLRRLHDGVQTVIPFNNQLPALLERSVGKGRALTMTTPITDPPNRDDAWNTLLSQQPAAWPYVALVNEVHLYLVGEAEGRFNYQTGQPAVLTVDPMEVPRQFAVRLPDEPEFRERLEPGARRVLVRQTEKAGNYQLFPTDGLTKLPLGFSVNIPGDQTDLSRLTRDELSTGLDSIPFQYARTRDELVLAQGKGRVGQELYSTFMVLLALILAAEFLLSTRFHRTV